MIRTYLASTYEAIFFFSNGAKRCVGDAHYPRKTNKESLLARVFLSFQLLSSSSLCFPLGFYTFLVLSLWLCYRFPHSSFLQQWISSAIWAKVLQLSIGPFGLTTAEVGMLQMLLDENEIGSFSHHSLSCSTVRYLLTLSLHCPHPSSSLSLLVPFPHASAPSQRSPWQDPALCWGEMFQLQTEKEVSTLATSCLFFPPLRVSGTGKPFRQHHPSSGEKDVVDRSGNRARSSGSLGSTKHG